MQDIPLPPKSSTRIHVWAAAPYKEQEPSFKERIPDVQFVCVHFLIVPDRHLVEWYDLAEEINMDDEKNARLVEAKLR